VRSLAYLQQRRPLYLDLARRHGWPVVDASQTPDAVHEAVAEIVWSAS
jgi:thymidylate kinase